MSTATWVTMIFVLAFIWGGFLIAVRKAIKSESVKSSVGPS